MVRTALGCCASCSCDAVQVARDMLNVTETGQLLRSLRSLGFQDLMSVLLVTTAALASPPSSNDAAVTKPHYAMPPAPPVQITSGSSKRMTLVHPFLRTATKLVTPRIGCRTCLEFCSHMNAEGYILLLDTNTPPQPLLRYKKTQGRPADGANLVQSGPAA